MACRYLGRLEFCLKSLVLPLPVTHESLTLCPLHGLPHRTTKGALTSQHIRCFSSNIVKSPFKDLVFPNQLIQELIWETVDRFPESTALKCGLTGRAFTYAEMQKFSLRFARSLQKAGFTKGEVIALVLPNCPEFAIITLGLLQADLSVSFINHVYTADEMSHQLKDSGSVCVITATEKLAVVLSATAKVEKDTQSKAFRKIIAVDIPPLESLPRGISRYSEMVADGVDQTEVYKSQAQTNDLAFLPYSSGTTGLSKGVCLSHRNIVCNILQSSEAMGIYSPDKEQDVVLGLLPFYHIYGLNVVLLNSLKNGAQIITLPKFQQETFITTIENEKITLMLLVPPLILFLGAHSQVKSEHLAHVRYIISGAAPLGAADMEKVRLKLPPQNNCDIFQAYGMTELSPVVTMPILPSRNLATVGVPIANTLGKIINPDTGEAAKPNQSGELCFKGPQVMLGYHNNPKATADTIDADGWLRTGDIGYYDEDNHFYVQDRLKELIKVKGFQVPPAELEEVLRAHPRVSDVGVIGVPCSRAGEVPVAYIVPQKDKKLTAEDIKAFLSEKVSRHKQVADVIFVDNIPKSAAGKILRKDLRELYKRTHNGHKV